MHACCNFHSALRFHFIELQHHAAARCQDVALRDFLADIRLHAPTLDTLQAAFLARTLPLALEHAVPAAVQMEADMQKPVTFLTVTNAAAAKINQLRVEMLQLRTSAQPMPADPEGGSQLGSLPASCTEYAFFSLAMVMSASLRWRLLALGCQCSPASLQKSRQRSRFRQWNSVCGLPLSLPFLVSTTRDLVLIARPLLPVTKVRKVLTDHVAVVLSDQGVLLLLHPITRNKRTFLPACYGYAMTMRRAQGSSLLWESCSLVLRFCFPLLPLQKPWLQGSTLDVVVLVFDFDLPDPGYAYVAASRVRTLASLYHVGEPRCTSQMCTNDLAIRHKPFLLAVVQPHSGS